MVCTQLRDAAYRELVQAELAATWMQAAHPTTPLATLMLHAVAMDRVDVAQELARLQNVPKRERQLALIEFVSKGDLHMCKVFLSKAGALAGALHAAAAAGHIEMCKLLLASGATVTGVSGTGMADGALSAARRARHANVCRLLMKHGVEECLQAGPPWDSCWFVEAVQRVQIGVDWTDCNTVLVAADKIYSQRI